MQPKSKPLSILKLVDEPEKQPDIAQAVSSAIIEIGKSADENARLLREAIEQILSSRTEPVARWTFDVVREANHNSEWYGLTKRVIATAEGRQSN